MVMMMMNDEWWWMMMTMISIRILIRFDDYPASGGNKLRMLRANKLMCLCSRRQHSWLTGPKGPSTVSRDRPLAFVFTGMSWDLDVWVVWSSVEWTRYILLVWFDQLLEVWIPFFAHLLLPNTSGIYNIDTMALQLICFFIFLVPSIDVICWHNSTPFPVVVPLLLTIRHLRNILTSMRSRKHQAICAQGHLNRSLAHWMFPGPLTSKSVCCMFLTNLWGSKRAFGFQESVDPWQGQRIAWWMGWTNWSSDCSDAGPWWSSCTPFGGEICSLHWRVGWVWWWFGRSRGQNNGLSMNSRFFPHLPGEGC